MRFLLDMGISPRAAAWLRARGHEALHVGEIDLQRAPDSQLLAQARKDGAILLTHDLGFGALMALPGLTTPSVVIFRLADMRPGNVIAYLELLLSRHEAALGEGAIVAVTERRIRLRRLPI